LAATGKTLVLEKIKLCHTCADMVLDDLDAYFGVC
jgi:hypothetical protein